MFSFISVRIHLFRLPSDGCVFASHHIKMASYTFLLIVKFYDLNRQQTHTHTYNTFIIHPSIHAFTCWCVRPFVNLVWLLLPQWKCNIIIYFDVLTTLKSVLCIKQNKSNNNNKKNNYLFSISYTPSLQMFLFTMMIRYNIYILMLLFYI